MYNCLSGILLSIGLTMAQTWTMETRCVIANQDVFCIKASAGGLSPKLRMQKINERLSYILGYGRLHRVRLLPSPGGDATIWVGGLQLVTVTWADARVNGYRSPQELGWVWLSNLQVALPLARP